MRNHLSYVGVWCALAFSVSAAMAQLPTPIPSPTPPALPNPPYAIVTCPPADPTAQTASVISPCLNGIFALVGLQPDQVVQVTVQYPTSQALQLVNLVALDGGMILPQGSVNIPVVSVVTPPGVGPILQQVPPQVWQLLENIDYSLIPATPRSLTLAIAADGTLSFTFVGAHDPGTNQISLRQGSQELGLQFWVFDPLNPQANPPAITPTTPYPAAAD